MKIQFDEKVAATYDEDSSRMFSDEVLTPTIDVLEELAGEGAALEFAVGTGRVALPLAGRGVPVRGIDVSAPMLAELEKKPGADQVSATVGDIATTRVEGEFQLVYLVFNTIMNLTTQDEQVACFRNAAAHLVPGGFFVIEVMVPELRRLAAGERIVPHGIRPSKFGFDEYTDFTKQILYSHHYWTEGDKLRTQSAPYRYVWPGELDLMARIAGMSLTERWADWNRTPFTDECQSHVSVWQKAPLRNT